MTSASIGCYLGHFVCYIVTCVPITIHTAAVATICDESPFAKHCAMAII